MSICKLCCCLFSLLAFALYGFEVKHVVFPHPSEVPDDLKIEPDDKITVAPDGTYLVNGKPRYIIQVKLAEAPPKTDMIVPTPGYPASMKWLYQTPIDFNIMQRIGFDMIGCDSKEWKNPYFTEQSKTNALWWKDPYLMKDGYYLHLLSPAGRWAFNKKKIKPDCSMDIINLSMNHSGNHFFPWNAVHPEGKKVYLEYFREMARFAKQNNGKVLRYELFNEPAFNHRSEYNRKQFAIYLEKKYGNIASLNKLWKTSYPDFRTVSQYKADSECAGLFIDWCKFMEETITSLCRDGVSAIHEIDPNAMICVQHMGGMNTRHTPMNHVNIFDVNKYMQAISLPTAGGVYPARGEFAAEHVIDTPSSTKAGEGRANVAYYLAMADGKPMHDDETYFGENGNLCFYMSMMRHLGSSAVFEWGKRGWECQTEEKCRIAAAKFPWFLLNPFSVNPQKFLEIMEFRKNANSVAEFYLRRDRGVKTNIALLISTPTERYSGFDGKLTQNYVNSSAAALMYGHWQFEAILEDQLAENRKNRYKVMISSGMRNAYAKTPEQLRKWTEDGGIFIALLDTFPMKEYGDLFANPLFDLKTGSPDDSAILYFGQRDQRIPGTLRGFNCKSIVSADKWERLGNAMCRKKLGKGWLYFIGVQFEDYSLASVLGGILQSHGFKPLCDITLDGRKELAPNIEVAQSKLDGLNSFMILNHDLYPKLLRFRAADLKAGMNVCVPFEKRILKTDKNASLLLAIAPLETRCIIFGDAKKIAKRSAGFCTVGENDIKKEFSSMKSLVKPKEEKGYHVNPADMKTLDLRKFANRHFIDGAEGDGKGGWSDQGAALSMNGVPFGKQTFLNVPCDIIRWDMNDERSIIVLDSKRVKPGFGVKRVDGIEVYEKVRALYFFHVSAWTTKEDGKPIITYQMHHRSGKISEYECEAGRDICDWWEPRKTVLKNKVAFTNYDKHGFYCVRWENPLKEDPIETVSIVSASGQSVPIVIAITAELQREKELPFNIGFAVPWGAVKCNISEDRNSAEFSITRDSKPWSGIHLYTKGKIKMTELKNKKDAALVFDIRGGKDLFGRQSSACKLSLHGILGLKRKNVNLNRYISNSWETVRIPFADIDPDASKYGDFHGLTFQFHNVPSAGVELRNIRITYQ